MDKFEKPLSVLVVDDEDGIRHILAETLRALGYTAIESQTAEQALKILEDHKIDVVMSDLYMPGESGNSLLQKIKRQRPHIPVIMISGYVNDSTKNQLMADGADGFLAKPFRITHVEELIAAALLKYDSRAEISNVQRTILIVDDDLELRRFLCSALGGLGYQTIDTDNSTNALKQIETGKTDLVISDYMLADSSGAELLRTIKSRKPKLPVVIMTGYPLAYSMEMAKADGVDGYLVKPFRINQIKEIIESLLRKE